MEETSFIILFISKKHGKHGLLLKGLPYPKRRFFFTRRDHWGGDWKLILMAQLGIQRVKLEMGRGGGGELFGMPQDDG